VNEALRYVQSHYGNKFILIYLYVPSSSLNLFVSTSVWQRAVAVPWLLLVLLVLGHTVNP